MPARQKRTARTSRTGLIVYRGKDGWRWRWFHENYRIGAEGGEAYASQANCRRGFMDYLADLQQHGASLLASAKGRVP